MFSLYFQAIQRRQHRVLFGHGATFRNQHFDLSLAPFTIHYRIININNKRINYIGNLVQLMFRISFITELQVLKGYFRYVLVFIYVFSKTRQISYNNVALFGYV